jgi:hypothetical protein
MRRKCCSLGRCKTRELRESGANCRIFFWGRRRIGWLCCKLREAAARTKQFAEKIPGDLSNSDPAVRLYREGRAENRLKDY